MRRSYYLRRIIPCALVILVCLFVVVMSIEVVGFTDEQRMRLAEKAHVVGPSDILGRESDLPVWGDVLIGQSRYGYTLYSCDSGELHYYKKMENFTTYVPNDLSGYDLQDAMPIFVFAENRQATHARLSMRLVSTLSGAPWDSTYTIEAQRSENGYFLFQMDLADEVHNGLLEFLTEMLNNMLCSRPWMYGTVTLEVYDDSGNLLEVFVRDYYVPEEE